MQKTLRKPRLIDGIKSTYDQILDEGFEQGIEKGIEQGIEQGIEHGIEKGIEKGIELERVKNIQKMILHGFDLATIATTLDLSLEYVERIKLSLK